jgi:hypothetical protein
LLIATVTATPSLAYYHHHLTPGVVVVLPEPAGDGDHTAAMAVGVRGAVVDITRVATAAGVMAHGGGADTIGVIERAPTNPAPRERATIG